jgi:putative FmdB family regulatory protein
MPFYEYECPKCGYQDEVLQKISDPPLKKCPSCGKNGLRKLMSAPVFRLKGSGWYETDFKSDKENKRNLVGADPEEAKSEAKAEAKPDAKADTKGGDAKADAKADAKPEAKDKSEAAKPAPAKARGTRAVKRPAKAKSASKTKRVARR